MGLLFVLLERDLGLVRKDSFTFTPKKTIRTPSAPGCIKALEEVQTAFYSQCARIKDKRDHALLHWLHYIATKKSDLEIDVEFRDGARKRRILFLESDGDLQLVLTFSYPPGFEDTYTSEVKPRIITRGEVGIDVPMSWASKSLLLALEQFLTQEKLIGYLVSKFGKEFPKIPQS